MHKSFLKCQSVYKLPLKCLCHSPAHQPLIEIILGKPAILLPEQHPIKQQGHRRRIHLRLDLINQKVNDIDFIELAALTQLVKEVAHARFVFLAVAVHQSFEFALEIA